jgi:hypothetical protein
VPGKIADPNHEKTPHWKERLKREIKQIFLCRTRLTRGMTCRERSCGKVVRQTGRASHTPLAFAPGNGDVVLPALTKEGGIAYASI